MTQPFREGEPLCHRPALWPELELAYVPDGIAISGFGNAQCASSAFYNGGLREASTILNRKVPLNYVCDDPVTEMRGYLEMQRYDADRTIGLLTAAKLTHASVREEAGDWFRLVVCATAGTRNSAKAGVRRAAFPAYRPGTINTVLLIDGRMTEAAMLNALMTATEAKSAALWDANIRDEYDAALRATGTTTDAVVAAVTQRADHPVEHAYAGCASEIGNAIGRLVYEAVAEAVRTQHEP